MGMVAPPQRIASAFFVLHGKQGDVTRLAAERGVPRPTLYRESHQVVAAVTGSDQEAKEALFQQRIAELEQRNADLAKRLADLEKQRPLTVTIDADKQAEFASIGESRGVTLSDLRALLQVLLGKAAPSIAKLGRYSHAAGKKAGELLAVLDKASRPLVRQGAPDEMFAGKKPILMMVEPESLCWVTGRSAPSRDGDEWAKEWEQFPALEQVTRDRATGMKRGLAKINAERVKRKQTPVADQSDHFHLSYAATKALRIQKNVAAQLLKKADVAQKKRKAVERRGQKNCSHEAKAAKKWWRLAEQAMDQWSQSEKAWQRLRDGLDLFTLTGELNSRARVEALIAEVEPQLVGAAWAKVRRLLAEPEICTSLDRVHEQLAALASGPAVGKPWTNLPIESEVREKLAAALPVSPEAVETLVAAEGIRRHPEITQGEGQAAAGQRGVLLLAGVVASLLGSVGPKAIAAVRSILRHTWRASSLVEGLNSVLRMQQAKHRRLTQELIDLKRLYWNCRVFRTGRRRKTSPYQRLGLLLPGKSWWELLKLSPEQLRHELSALNRAA